MGERLIKPYEISVWEEKLIQDGAEYRFEERKLAVIGSNTMTGLNKVYDPVFNKKSNGEKTLSFSLKYKYFDPYSGNSDFVNPFAALLTNERKVKLYYDNKWYEFIVKEHNESSDELTWTYTCTDAFVLELSKQGYNITFDSELNNNQGTATQLAKETLKDTDWLVGGKDIFKQLIEEPIYKAILNPTGITIINASGNQDIIPTTQTNIYLFYSFVKNQDGKNIQFIIYDENRNYTIDDKGVITDTNFRITTELFYDNNCFKDANDNIIITIQEVETKYHANRLAYGQLNVYDPIMGRTVNRYQVYENNQPSDQEVYEYIDYTYTTSNIVTNYITNGDNFNVLEDGSLQGWNPYTDQSLGENNKPKPVNKLELVTRPELGSNRKLVDIATLSQIEGFLKVKFNGPRATVDNHYCNTVYNSGIENNSSTVQSIAKGDKFVFRWRAGIRDATVSDESISDVDCLIPYQNLRIMVAEYTKDEANRFGNYYKHINVNDVIFDFSGTPKVKNNYITGGILKAIEDEDEDDSNNKYEYVINGVVQTPSTKYIYEDSQTHIKYTWDNLTGDFIPINESSAESYKQYLPYYYLTSTAIKGVSTASLSDPKYKIGIFLYARDNANPIYIQDIQLTRYIEDVDTNGEPILIGNVPTATAKTTSYYYLKPETGDEADSIITYTDLNELINDIYDNTVTIKPLYNENSEKNLSISVSQSNCFNILQTIAETFECWIDLVVDHDDRGYITKTNGRPNKYVYLREYAGKENWAGFKYGVNLSSIERNINSDEIVTKLIIDQSQSDLVDEGYISITNAPSNQSGESYIINFDYYYNQGLLNKEEVEKDRLTYSTKFAKLNKDLKEKNTERNNLELALTKINSNRDVYTTLIETAQDTQMDALAKFEELTGISYEKYQEIHNGVLDGIDATDIFDRVDSEVDYQTFTLSGVPVVDSNITVTIQAWNAEYEFIGGEEKNITNESEEVILSYNGATKFTIYGTILEPDIVIEYIKDINASKLTEEENVLKTLGEIYVSSATINNYSGLLSNVDKEYWIIHDTLKGSENYKIKIWTGKDVNLQRHVFVELNEFFPGIQFRVGTHEYTTSITKRFFDIETEETNFIIESVPQNYSADETQYTINDNKIFTIKISCDKTTFGIEDEIEELREQKDELTKEFNNKYSHFIQEGTWNSTDYIDSERYYLDALQVSNTSAQPAVSYTINVVEISEIEGFEWYTFDAGDKTYVEDTEFFGWTKENIGTEENPEFIYTPAREEVIVSEVEWHLEEPENNVITVQNYKTRFEDLFQRISATVQTVQYNEATYAKISTLLDANGTINSDVLLNSLNNISGQKYALTTDGSITINGNEILIRNLTNPTNRVIINNEGISVSADGGNTWKNVIDGFGVNADAIITGSLSTKLITIGNSDSPSFRWDQAGISAYRSDGTMTDAEGNIISAYDLQTFVRYDQNGLYGIKNGNSLKPYTLEEIKDKAHFAVTWDGFFIKNSYPGGGRVEITSDNDFRVLNTINNQLNEKIKIGALEWKQENWHEGDPIYTDPATIPENIKQLGPSLYGIRIKNNAGIEVMKTDDQGNIHITGDITATSGHIGGMVVNNNSLTMDTIVLEPGVGIYSTIQTDNNPTFIISDTNGNATFNQITARGHIEAQTGTLGELEVIDTITVGAQGAIESSNWSIQNQTGWHIDDNGATFNNANVRGTITALQGDFLGRVNVGPTGQGQEHIIIDGESAKIKSSNYEDGAGYGWMINKDGDAVFNNITARGAIKTAVFEYAEIQAVGGIFIFRPSSTIKSARISGNSLVLKVEKPALFAKAVYTLSEDTTIDISKTYYIKGNYGYIIVDTPVGNPHENEYYEMHTEFQSWCKISNYTTDGTEPNVNNILLSNGLIHVYRVLDVNLNTAEVTLENGIQFINGVIQQDQTIADVLAGLEGGALVDMGREDGSSNYGIGINSSDNTVNLPRRAISLFETIIDPSKSPKVSYKYRGILGTLPDPIESNINVNSSIYNNMIGTQGIYTNNMYIGDNKNFITYYYDKTANEYRLIINADTIYEGYDDDENPIPITPGQDGEDAITVIIDSSTGNMFVRQDVRATLTCHVYQGSGMDPEHEITDQVTKFTWVKYDKDGIKDETWARLPGGQSITIGPEDVASKAIFKCEVEF